MHNPTVCGVHLLTEQNQTSLNHIQGSAKRRSPGFVNFVTAVAYHLCLAMPAAFTQPGDHILAELCRGGRVRAKIDVCVVHLTSLVAWRPPLMCWMDHARIFIFIGRSVVGSSGKIPLLGLKISGI